MTLIKTSAIALMATFGITAANAQQLPNSGFEAWEDCYPWNSDNTNSKQSITPTDWCVSNVTTKGMQAGNATIAKKVTGNNSENAVNVYNISAAGQTIPGYVTLGTTWSTACIRLATIQEGSTDGGTWGNVAFTNTPDALSVEYIRTQGSGSTQPASVIAYMWKGETTQAEVPANNAYKFAFSGAFPTATKVTMTDRDRNVLGMTTLLGGEVTKSDDFELIAKFEHKITTANSEWATLEVPFEYLSNATPTKINVIMSAGAYFADRSAHKKDDALTIDNVRLIYYSRLSSLKVDGVEVPDFAENKYDYTIDTPYSPDAVVEATAKGQSAKIQSVVYNDTDYTVTVTVSNVDADSDGQASHSYVIKFAEPVAKGTTFDGSIKIFLGGGEPMEVLDQHVTITPTADGLCEFSLLNFSLDGNPENSLGDIIVPGVKISTAELSGKTWTKYDGEAKGIELAGGEIKADAVIEAYEDENHNMVAFIHVTWIMDEENSIPIEVEFRTDNFDILTGIDDVIDDATDATPHYYLINGTEVKAPSAPGLYIVRRGNTVTKIVK